MTHNEDKCIVKWSVHNTQLFRCRALPETYFLFIWKDLQCNLLSLLQKKLVLENNSLLLPLTSSHLQKSLGQSKIVHSGSLWLISEVTWLPFLFFFVVIWQEVWNYFHVHKYAWGDMELWESFSDCSCLGSHLRSLLFRLIAL